MRPPLRILMAEIDIQSLKIPSLSRRGQGRLPVPGYGPTTNANCDFQDFVMDRTTQPTPYHPGLPTMVGTSPGYPGSVARYL